MLNVERLVKKYEGGIIALDNVTFEINRKCILTVAGPNGAGKTTLLRIISTALLPTSGNVSVLGFDVVREAKKIREKVAVVPQDSYPEPYLTPLQFVSWYLVARGMSISDSKKQAQYALELLQLEHVRNRKCLTLSGGERKRVIVAAVIATNADLLILDEPTAGLDPIGRKAVYNIIKRLSNDHGIIMSTHLLAEAEAVAEEALIINKGQMLAMGSIKELTRKIVGYEYKIIVEEANQNLETYLRSLDTRFLSENGKALIYLKSSEELQRVLPTLTGLKLNFTVKKLDLEDAFIQLVSNR